MQLGRATMELANRLRSAEELLRSDLSHLTVEPRPYTETTNPNGYFEYIEFLPGEVLNAAELKDNYKGDVDDIIAMTVKSDGQFFRGRQNGEIIESPVAEVLWYTTFENRAENNSVNLDYNESLKVHRRVLLVRPDLGLLSPSGNDGPLGQSLDWIKDFIKNNDISCRTIYDPSQNPNEEYFLYANNLEDLALRTNRFGRHRDTQKNWPHALERNRINELVPDGGLDIVLTDVASFDMKVFSPDVSVALDDDIPVSPADVGFYSIVPSNLSAGDFVDLSQNDQGEFPGVNSQFSTNVGKPNVPPRFYDTWTPAYENDGIDQDGLYGIDQGTNGLDDNGPLAADDDSERETRPPYPYPIRGVKVSIRLIEKTTNQVYQSSVVHSYVPE
jgi:hypothetical protein